MVLPIKAYTGLTIFLFSALVLGFSRNMSIIVTVDAMGYSMAATVGRDALVQTPLAVPTETQGVLAHLVLLQGQLLCLCILLLQVLHPVLQDGSLLVLPLDVG